jgi:hypothetical protein
LYEIFDFYCNFGRSMVQDYQESLDSFMFMKFARECPNLLGGAVDRTTVDLVFTKAKPKFERRLNFSHFLDALSAIAEKKYPDCSARDALHMVLTNHLVPHYDLVQREVVKTGETEVPLTGIYKRLYDPRSYTGVYAERFRSGDGRINGDTDIRLGRKYRGSTNTGTDETIHDISVLMRPHLHAGGTMMSPVNHVSFRSRKRRTGDTGTGSIPASARSKSPGASLRGASAPGSASSSVRGRPARGRPRRSRHAITAERTTVQLMAELNETLAATMEGRSEDASAAQLRAQALRELVNEAEAAARAEEMAAELAEGEELVPEPTREVLEDLAATAPPLDQERIKEMFFFYCNFGRTRAQAFQDTLDGFMFMKFCRECPHLLGGAVDRTTVDLIFTKAKAKGERRLTFSHFLDALSAIAEKKYERFSAPDALRLLIRRNLAPHYELVTAEQRKTGETEVPLTGIFKRLYDPRSYTGVYAERFKSGDGRINGEADNRAGRTFMGSTNTGTDEIIHDISVLMRPNLRSGTMMRSRPKTAGGSPRRRAKGGTPSSRLTSATASSAARARELDEAAATRGYMY